ncbi:MAG TPA: response regulator [Stellaceae bacterium]|nr:response regulator [Stellaceae bacterium]
MEWEVSKVVRPATGRRILVIEDEETIRLIFHHVLTSAGYAVDSADTVAAGLKLLRSRSYDLVIADDRLPDGRGLELADRARAKGIAAVVLTGYALQMKKEELSRYDLLLKPMRPLELVAEVERRIAGRAEPS